MVGLVAGLAFAAGPALDEQNPLPPTDTVLLADMTWMEARDALAKGQTTVLVPTGGHEQNGPFLVLGKHDKIASEVAERTARNLGDALVAPVVSFVPEGSIRPTTGHMAYTGTLTVSDSTFEALLTDIAASYRHHGFDHIVFVGDSGGNQAVQASLAASLDNRWTDVRVHHSERFYDPVDTLDVVEKAGLTWADDSYHDDPAFTFQLLAIDQNAARLEQRLAAGLTLTDGVDLVPVDERLALGERLLAHRAQRAADEIRSLRDQPPASRWSSWMALLAKPFTLFTDPHERLFGGYIVLAFITALFLVILRQGREWSLTSAMAELFPKQTLVGRDFRNDVIWTFCGGVALYFATVALFGGVAGWLSSYVMAGLYTVADSPSLPAHPVVVLASTLLLAMATDFGIYWGHWLQHRVPFLWAFHRTHHSAKELNPLTVYRMHPVDLLVTDVTGVVCVGVGTGLLTWVFDASPPQWAMFKLNIVVFAFYLIGFNLRHTHIWLSYGWLNRIFVSPAMHQIHHSEAEHHWDKNMGVVFSFWDQLFGTAYLPKEREELTFGLGDDSENFATAWDFLIEPFRTILRR